MLTRPYKLLSVLVLLCGVATPASATVVFDNFGPSDSYNNGIGWTIAGTTSVGMQFSPSSSGFFSLLTVALGTTSTPPTSFEMVLQSDNAGFPGTTLETLNFNVSTFFGTGGSPTVVAADGSVFLDSSMSYWLIAFSPTGTNVPWNWNDTGDLGGLASRSGINRPWSVDPSSTLGAFRIEVSEAVPEPTTLPLLGSGLGLMGLFGWGRKRRLSAS
jgi:hypothetical protein